MTPRVVFIGFLIACAAALALILYLETHPPQPASPPATKTTTHHADGAPQGPCWGCQVTP